MRRLGFTSLFVGWLLALGCTPKYSQLPLAPPLEYSVGEDQLRQGKTADAIRTFEAYLDTGRPTYRARALYQLARAQYMSENYPAALDSLNQLEKEFPDVSTKQANALRGDIAYATAHRIDAVLLWEKAYLAGLPSEKEALEPRIRAAIDGMTEDEAIELANLATAPEIYNMAIDRLPSAALPGERAERPVTTAEQLDKAQGGPEVTAAAPTDRAGIEHGAPGNLTAEEASQTVDQTAAADAGAEAESPDNGRGPHVACLLPLTGSDRLAGHLALGQLRRAFTGSSAHLIVRDSGSDAALAARLTGQLAEDPTILALIGPVGAAEVARAAPVAKAAGLPMLPLSSAAGSEDLPSQAQHAADTVLESIDVAGDDTRDRVRQTLQQKKTDTPAASPTPIVR